MRLNRLIIVFFLLGYMCCIYPIASLGQIYPKKDFIISAEGHYGFIMSHKNNMAHLIKGHIYGGELSYTFRTDGCKPWQQIYKYPEIGLCVSTMYLANPQQLGNLGALYPFINLRLNKVSSKVLLNLRLGEGLAYVTKRFDRINNHKNNVIGSHLNGFVNIRLNASTLIANTWRMNGGIGLSHASNGAAKTPNLGINMVTVNAGIGYVFGNKCIDVRMDTIIPCDKDWKISLMAISGVKEREVPYGPKYLVLGLQTNVYKTLNYKNKIGGGLETTYNYATIAEWTRDSIPTKKFADIIQVGAKFSYAYVINKLSFPVDFGVYFYKRQNANGQFFHRIGMRYMLTKHLIANLTLLTHWAKADYFEGGIGYEF